MIGQTISVLATLIAAPAVFTVRANETPARPCASAEYRQFDFWVGSWDVYPTGGSLNIYVRAEKGWRQTWIDSSGARVDFKGGLIGGKMVLEGVWQDFVAPGKSALVRMTYSQGSDRSVRQLGEASEDNGKSWHSSFDFTYRPTKHS